MSLNGTPSAAQRRPPQLQIVAAARSLSSLSFGQVLVCSFFSCRSSPGFISLQKTIALSSRNQRTSPELSSTLLLSPVIRSEPFSRVHCCLRMKSRRWCVEVGLFRTHCLEGEFPSTIHFLSNLLLSQLIPGATGLGLWPVNNKYLGQ